MSAARLAPHGAGAACGSMPDGILRCAVEASAVARVPAESTASAVGRSLVETPIGRSSPPRGIRPAADALSEARDFARNHARRRMLSARRAESGHEKSLGRIALVREI